MANRPRANTVQLIGVDFDDVESGLVTVDHAQHELNLGQVFFASYATPDGSPLADDAAVDLLIKTASKKAHLTFSGSSEGNAELQFYEGTTTSDDGTSVTPQHMDRTSNVPTSITTFHTPTVTAVGTLVYDRWIVAGDGGGADGGRLRSNREWILAPNTNYMVRVINRAGNNQHADASVSFYETDN